MTLILSKNVKNDIKKIYNYIAKNSLKYAKETSNNIYSCIAELESSPYLGRYVPELSDKRYRELLYKSYRIVYSVYENTNIIYIHFIIHSKRNLKSFYNTYISKN